MYTDREIVEASLPGNMTGITDVLLKKALFAKRFTPQKVHDMLLHIEDLKAENENLKAKLDLVILWACDLRKAKECPVNLQIKDLQYENERLKDFVNRFADEPCEYGDNCPPFVKLNHYPCDNCVAKRALGVSDD